MASKATFFMVAQLTYSWGLSGAISVRIDREIGQHVT